MILGLVLHLVCSSGWAATTYCLLAENPSIDVRVSDTAVNIPLRFSPYVGVQHFTLSVSYDPNFVTLGNLQGSDITSYDSLHLAINKVIERTDGGTRANAVMIGACVRMKAENMLEAWSLDTAQPAGKFLTLPFTINKDVDSMAKAGKSTYITIEGFVGQNQIQELTPTTVKVNFSDVLCTVNIKPTGLPENHPYTIRLWSADRTIERKKDTNISGYSTFELKPGNTYWAVVESIGYQSSTLQKIVIGPAETSKPNYDFAMTAIKSRIAVVRKVTTEKKLELGFGYRNSRGQIVSWPENDANTLAVNFTGRDGKAGPSVTLNPRTGVYSPSASAFVSYGFPQIITPPTGGGLFGQAKYISMTIDPNAYYVTKEIKSNKIVYTISFETGTLTEGVERFTSTIEVEVPVSAGSIDMTRVSIAQATNTFTGSEIASVGEMTVKGNFYLNQNTHQEIVTEFKANEMSLNYLKGTAPAAGQAGDYIDPNKLSQTRFNLAVEFKPLEAKTDITVVKIDFTDENGKSFEYDPPEEVRASAGPIIIEVPLHKGLQTYLKQHYYPDTSLPDSLESATLEEIYAHCLRTEESHNPASPDYVKPESTAPKRYGIYFQRAGKKAELFIPNTSWGEGIELRYHDKLLFARVTTKHTSDWFTAVEEEVVEEPEQTTTTATTTKPPKKSEGDHWYECFIKAIRPGFFQK